MCIYIYMYYLYIYICGVLSGYNMFFQCGTYYTWFLDMSSNVVTIPKISNLLWSWGPTCNSGHGIPGKRRRDPTEAKTERFDER